MRTIFYSKDFKEIHRTDLQFIPKENELVCLSKAKNLLDHEKNEHYRVLQVRHEIDENLVSIYIDYPTENIKPTIKVDYVSNENIILTKEDILESITGILSSNKLTDAINIPIGWIYQAMEMYVNEQNKNSLYKETLTNLLLKVVETSGKKYDIFYELKLEEVLELEKLLEKYAIENRLNYRK